MLRRIFQELTRSLRTRSQTASNQDPLEQWKKDYSAATNPVAQGQVLQALDAWLQQQPNHLLGWVFLGDALQRQGELPAAENAYRKALRLDPTHAAAHEGVGLVLLHQGNLDQAWLHLEAAHKADPQNPDILVHWGLVALEQGNLGEASKNFEKAIERNVEHHHAWHNLGLAHIKMGNTHKGIQYFERALELRPEFGLAWSNLALAQRDAEQLDQALESARRASQFKSNSARVWVILGDILTDAGRWPEADAALSTALGRDPNDTGAHIALGKLRAAQAQYPEAEAAYRRALALDPNNPEAMGGLGQLEILLGRFNTGWEHYEARRRTDNSPVRHFPLQPWMGMPIPGCGLLVHAEQGLGDIIIFAGCLPDLLAQTTAWGTQVVVETSLRLAALFQRSFPQVRVVGRERNDADISWLDDLHCQYEIPIGSLPRLYCNRTQQPPQRTPYLQADAAQVQHWRQLLEARGSGPYVGVTWRGGLLRSGSMQRSIEPLALLQTLVRCGVQPVCLQHGEVDAMLAEAAQQLGVPVWYWPEIVHDLDAAAALTQALDAVVTVCNTQAHLTGALARPGWVLVPQSPNWRYGANGEQSWWYPTLRLLRQPQGSNWQAPLQQLEQELQVWRTNQIANNTTPPRTTP